MGWLSGSPSAERSRSLLRWAWWRAILSGPSQFLRELHFIEATICAQPFRLRRGRSSFGNCTSLRLEEDGSRVGCDRSQFLRELHFIEAPTPQPGGCRTSSRSFFANCTSLRVVVLGGLDDHEVVVGPSGTALH